MYSRNRQASKIPNILVSFVIITTIISNAQILKRLPALFTKHMMGAGQLVTVQKSKQKSNIIYTESHSHTHTHSLSLSLTHTLSLSYTHTPRTYQTESNRAGLVREIQAEEMCLQSRLK